jgi:3-hydroxyacyl-CoA dehydrogenase / enoyl-CoA hydratase / 3-hydroxybutyryl-CoA epimerase
MNPKSFRYEVEPDGVAVATWDMPGRSMNVIGHKI